MNYITFNILGIGTSSVRLHVNCMAGQYNTEKYDIQVPIYTLPLLLLK